MAKMIWLPLLALASGCTPTEPPRSSDPSREHYEARGQEPGWSLTIDRGRIVYLGHYGEQRIEVARPEPRPSFNGLRYVTPRLVVDVTYSRCNDAMSGFGFEHQVMVSVGDETMRGCGGARKPEWDL